MVIAVSAVQPLNSSLPITVILTDSLTDVKPLQPKNALSPIVVTLSGISIDVKPLQPSTHSRR